MSDETRASWSKAIFGNRHFADAVLAIDACDAAVHVRAIAAVLGVPDPVIRGIFARLETAGVLRDPLKFDGKLSYDVDGVALKRLVRLVRAVEDVEQLTEQRVRKLST